MDSWIFDNQFNEIINNEKAIFYRNSERIKKRKDQIQKRKKLLRPLDFSSMQSLQENSLRSNEDLIAISSYIPPLNANEYKKFSTKFNNKKDEEEVEINISNLDSSVEIQEEENSINQLVNNNNKIDLFKKDASLYSSPQKSFIHLNNNLVTKVAAQKERRSHSYMMALYPELFKGNINQKKIITQYDVDEIIREENESEHAFNLKKRTKKLNKLLRNDRLELFPYGQNKSVFSNYRRNFMNHFKISRTLESIGNEQNSKHSRQESLRNDSLLLTTKEEMTPFNSIKKFMKLINHKKSQSVYSPKNFCSLNTFTYVHQSLKAKKNLVNYKKEKSKWHSFQIKQNLLTIASNDASLDNTNRDFISTKNSSYLWSTNNKDKIIKAMLKLKYIPLSSYSYALNALNKSKQNLFSILVCKDYKNNFFLFKGIYEIRQVEQKNKSKIAYKLFSIGSCPLKINSKDVKNFYTYNKTETDFIKCKSNPNSDKNFGYHSILIVI